MNVKVRLFAILYREFQQLRSRSASDGPVGTHNNHRFPEFPEPCHNIIVAMQELDTTKRAALSLFYIGMHSWREIAMILALPAEMAIPIISQAKERLHRSLENHPPSRPTDRNAA